MKIYTRDIISILIVLGVLIGFHILGFFEPGSILSQLVAPLRDKVYFTIEDTEDMFNETEMKGYSPEEGYLMLSDFETPDELQKWRYDGVVLYQSDEFKSSGNQSGKVEFLTGHGDAPKLFLQYFPKRWSNFEALNFEIYNPSESKLRLILQIKDRSGDRFKYNLNLEPTQWNRFSVPIDDMAGEINVDKVVDLNFFRWKPSSDATVYIDDVKLITSQYEETAIYPSPETSQQKVRDISSGDEHEISKTYFAEGNTINFYVKNPNGIEIKSFPCSGIVDFPQSKVFEKTPMLLKGPDGHDIPYQINVTSFWNDNSFKQARLDFQASFDANQEKQFILYYGNDLAKMNFKSGITVRYKEDVIQVSTGKLRFNLNKNSFTLLDKAWLDKNNDGFYSENEVVADAGDIIMTYNSIFYQSSYDYSTYKIELLEAGPLRTTFRAEGYLRSNGGYDLCKYQAVITAFADQSFVEISLNFIFSKTAPVESAAFSLKYPEDFSQVYSPNTGVQMNLPVMILQSDDEKSEVRSQGRKLTFDQDLSQWIDASNMMGGVTVAIKPYWTLPQFGYYVQKNDIAAMLWPPYAQEIDIQYTQNFKMKADNQNLRNPDFERTHDVMIYFHSSDPEEVYTTEIAEAFLNPIIFSTR